MDDTAVMNAAAMRPPARLDREVLTESTTVAVDAAPASTEAAVRRLDLAAPLARALAALDAGGRFALVPARMGRAGGGGAWLFGTVWRIAAGSAAERIRPECFESFRAPGYVKVRWAVEVAPSEGGALLSIASSFAATDDRSAARLRDAWSVIGPDSSNSRMILSSVS